MKTTDNVGFTFANIVIGSGAYHGIVNVTLGALPFNPTDDGTVSTEIVITSRLRMDVACAERLRDELDSLLSKIKNPVTAESVAATNGAEHKGH